MNYGLALDEMELQVAHGEPSAMAVEIRLPDLLEADVRVEGRRPAHI